MRPLLEILVIFLIFLVAAAVLQPQTPRFHQTRQLTIHNQQESEAPIDPLSALELDLQGFIHVADDGVARSYRADGTVIDYVPLTNEQLLQFIPMYTDDEATQKNFKEVWKGVNGHDVVDRKQIFEPGADLLPFEFSHPDLWAADLAKFTPIESNPATEALEGSQPYRRGKQCTTSGACRYMGCHRCAYADAAMSPRWKICY
ncbi:uncharacterized protein CDV56_104436 [Aspergillus thermomutatus]|uniref:Uncharacterized protein n=1 Tax=Aspergillus thermomutatus TaxID=41047 RepID=A0A397H6S5_ASPTH|nr:uncharacterized protein CDV56_104436 [Aspergillus thermomutatus]RHZ57394.1 hypothetical protein CDV56_104436 [Aspergillus thermomutatus]